MPMGDVERAEVVALRKARERLRCALEAAEEIRLESIDLRWRIHVEHEPLWNSQEHRALWRCHRARSLPPD